MVTVMSITIKNAVLIVYELSMTFCYSTDFYDSAVFLRRLLTYYHKIILMVIIWADLLPVDDMIEAWQVIISARIVLPKYLIFAIAVWDVPTLLVFVFMSCNFRNIRFHLEPRDEFSMTEVRNLVFWWLALETFFCMRVLQDLVWKIIEVKTLLT
jgi:hypothetical protein